MDLFEEVHQIVKDIEGADISNADILEQFRIKYLGSKNIIKLFLAT